MRLPIILTAITLAALLSGCAGPLGPLLSLTASAVSGAQYSMKGVVSQSYPASVSTVRKASQEAMAQLRIPLTTQGKLPHGVRLLGKTNSFPVIVDVESVTPVVTRVTVTAGNTYFTLDRATAQALTHRIGVVLERYAFLESMPVS
jgi:hypothetical protein